MEDAAVVLNSIPAEGLSTVIQLTVDRLSGAYDPEGAESTNLELVSAVDALTQFFVEGIRRGLSPSDFHDFLSATALQSAIVELVSDAYSNHGSALANCCGEGRDTTKVTTDELVGVQWTSGHCLGNRTVDPPQRSLPFITVTLDTQDVNGNKQHVPFVCSTEQAQDLLAKLKDALHEAEVVSQANIGKRKGK